MAQMSRTSNPTDLLNIDKRHVTVRVHGTSSDLEFSVERIDFQSAKLPSDALVSCVAHAGNAEEYFQLGRASGVNTSRHRISGLDNDHPLRFRFLFTTPGEPKLIGFTDGVRAVNETGDLGPSLVDIEPKDLNGPAWRLLLPDAAAGEGEKPNILVERTIFPTAYAAASCPWFSGLVMPEVMRQIATAISRNGDALDDEGSWMHPWKLFLDNLQIPPPPQDTDPESDEAGELSAWAESVVERFCKGHSVRASLDFMEASIQGEETR